MGLPVTATDSDPGDTVRYELDPASDLFTIDNNGKILVKTSGSLNHETEPSHTVTVKASDSSNAFATVDVEITVEDVNEAPTAVRDTATTNEDESVTIDVLDNDTDPENDTLTVTSVSRPGKGSATVDSDGTITYTPDANYHGSDSFAYRARDTDGLTSATPATVTLTIDGVNDDPVFASATVERSVSESANPGVEVGAPVAATDVDENDNLTYSLSGTDAGFFDIGRRSGQITVGAGVTFNVARKDTYTVTVEAEDGKGGRASVDATITVTTGPVRPVIIIGGGGGGGPSGPSPSKLDFEWTVKHDIESLDSANDAPTGVWSDGTTLWVADNPDGAGDAVYAYDAETGERLEGREFPLDEGNRAPRGIWSGGEGVVWVSDSGRDRLFAYDLTTGERLEERDIELGEENSDPRGIWSDGATMWVLNRNPSLFAYELASGEVLGEYALDSRNGDPYGIWSDGVTVWISDHGEKDLLAYRLPTRQDAEAAGEDASLERVRDEDFTELSNASNNSPRGIWSDGDAMYVADESDEKAYTYNMPDAIDARLASLTLEGVDIGEFDPDQTDYEGVIAEGVTETVVTAEAMQRRTDVEVKPDDTDGDDTNGHRVALQEIDEITVTVTSADGSCGKVYRVTVQRPEEELELAPTWTAIAWPGADGVTTADALRDGGVSDRVLVIYKWDEASQTWMGFFPGLEDVPGLNTLTTFKRGGTYWIAVTEALTWPIPLAATP